jgi:hypothetical protein
LERGASLECKDEEGAIPLHDACAGGVYSWTYNSFMPLVIILFYFSCLTFFGTGFTEMVQYILNFAANKDGCVVRMLNTVDSEGDTVSSTNLSIIPKLIFSAVYCKEN